MRRELASWTGMVAAVALAVLSAPVSAQPADALGKPLPSAKLADGTVTVRVVKGDTAKPYVGIDVSVVAGERTLTARTDSDGRATFPQVPHGVELIAKAVTAEGEARSQAFSAPERGGLQFLLSPVPMAAGPMMGGAGGAGGAMPEPRKMSGQPRPEGSNPVGTLTVRVVYDSVQDANAVGVPVMLVGYGSDDSLSAVTATTDEHGRARFDGLQLMGRTAYYAMALVPRDDVVDRLTSNPVVMPADSGVALMLSAEAKGSKKPALDETNRFEMREGTVAAGQVAVRLTGALDGPPEIELYDALAAKSVGKMSAKTYEPSPEEIEGAAGKLASDVKIAAGTLSVAVAFQGARGVRGIADAPVRVKPYQAAGAAPLAAPPPVVAGTTATNGIVTLSGLALATPLVAEAEVRGKVVTSEPFTLAAANGGRLAFTFRWPEVTELEAVFTDLPAELADHPLVAQIRSNGRIQRSGPFQITASRGAGARVLVLPQRVLFKFHLGGILDDQFLGWQGALSVQNWSYAPVDPGVEGLVIPLPMGFSGAQVEERVKERVAVDPERGLIWRGFIPPGNSDFRAGFSLRVHDGAVGFDLALPIGTFDSDLSMLNVAGMKVELPSGVRASEGRNQNGQRLYMISDINIPAQKSMVLRITNLPREPGWRRWVRWTVGGVVLSLVLLAAAVALARRGRLGSGDDRQRELRRRQDELIDEIVRLEKRLKGGAIEGATARKERKRYEAELETIYLELSQREPAGASE